MAQNLTGKLQEDRRTVLEAVLLANSRLVASSLPLLGNPMQGGQTHRANARTSTTTPSLWGSGGTSLPPHTPETWSECPTTKQNPRQKRS